MDKVSLLQLYILFTNFNKILTFKSEVFTEELLIKPLYGQQLYAHFHFNTKWDTDPDFENFQHCRLFPRAVGELIERYNVEELHISLTGGLWRYESWGYPVTDAAPGAELWVWFRPNTVDVDKNWKKLAASLSGLLCASLNFVEESNTIAPEFSFQPRGVVEGKVNNSFVRYAALPREIVCTENLTPWKKLLPCESKAGLASLLNSDYVHNTRYHSLALHFRAICRNDECNSRSLEVRQTISLVYDYQILGTKHWSFRRLFGQGLMSSCPLSSNSTIYVDISSNGSVPFQLNPSADEYLISYRGGSVSEYAKYQVKNYAMTLYTNYIGNSGVLLNPPPPITANQYIIGYGHEKGGIAVNIENNHWAEIKVVVLQIIPWYVPIYLHTFKVRIAGEIVQPLELHYKPGKARKRPYHLESVIKLPARSSCVLSIDFDYVFLKWQEYPPDANHGFYIDSAIISANLPLAKNYTGLPQDASKLSDSFNASRSSYLIQVRTENLVITLPTPDFSMPYNVICLACTVVALAFGPLHNITTKRLVLKPNDDDYFLVKMKRRCLKLLRLFVKE